MFDWTSWFRDANFPSHSHAVKPDGGTKALPGGVFKISTQCGVEREMFQNKAFKINILYFPRRALKLLWTLSLGKRTECDELYTCMYIVQYFQTSQLVIKRLLHIYFSNFKAFSRNLKRLRKYQQNAYERFYSAVVFQYKINVIRKKGK